MIFEQDTSLIYPQVPSHNFSDNQVRRHRKNRDCRNCHQHRARFLIDGKARWDPEHDLCPRCHRSLKDQQNAKRVKPAARNC